MIETAGHRRNKLACILYNHHFIYKLYPYKRPSMSPKPKKRKSRV